MRDNQENKIFFPFQPSQKKIIFVPTNTIEISEYSASKTIQIYLTV